MDIFEKISNKITNFICNTKGSTQEEKKIIKYGIHNFIINIYKIPILILIAHMLNILPEFIIIFLCLSIVRLFAFGIHARTSIGCLISTITIFSFIGITSKYFNILDYQIHFLYILNILSLYLFAPADTEKRPIINKKRRMQMKIKSIICLTIIYIIILTSKQNNIKYILTLSSFISTLSINPIIYKILGHKYNNYINYNKSKINPAN